MKKMMKLLRPVLMAFISIITLVCLTGKVKCQNVYIDPDGYFCVECTDKYRSSSITYHTYGFSISRCAYNPARKQLHSGAATEFFTVDSIAASLAENVVDGIAFNVFRMPVEELFAKASPEWAKEVRDAMNGTGPAVYIKFDSIMEVLHGKVVKKNEFHNFPPEDGRNPAEIKAEEAWANPSGLNSHYNRYILIGGKVEGSVIAEDYEEDKLVSDGLEHSPLEYWAGNEATGGKYNLMGETI